MLFLGASNPGRVPNSVTKKRRNIRKEITLDQTITFYEDVSIYQGFRNSGRVVPQDGGQREMDQHASPYHLPASCAPTSLRCWRERSPGTAA